MKIRQHYVETKLSLTPYIVRCPNFPRDETKANDLKPQSLMFHCIIIKFWRYQFRTYSTDLSRMYQAHLQKF